MRRLISLWAIMVVVAVMMFGGVATAKKQSYQIMPYCTYFYWRCMDRCNNPPPVYCQALEICFPGVKACPFHCLMLYGYCHFVRTNPQFKDKPVIKKLVKVTHKCAVKCIMNSGKCKPSGKPSGKISKFCQDRFRGCLDNCGRK